MQSKRFCWWTRWNEKKFGSNQNVEFWKIFQTSLPNFSKGHNESCHYKGRLLALSENIGQGWKWLTVANIQGGQSYWLFPFSKDSLLWVIIGVKKLQQCDNDIVSQSNSKTSELCSVERTVCLSDESMLCESRSWELLFLLNWYQPVVFYEM